MPAQVSAIIEDKKVTGVPAFISLCQHVGSLRYTEVLLFQISISGFKLR